MGKIYDSLLAGSSGRTGRIVVGNVNGHEISRIRPKKRTKAPSEKQLLVQQRMKLAIDFMTSYRAYACKHYGYRTGMRSSYNQAFTNITTNLVIDYSTATITPNYQNICFSKGALLAAIPLSITLVSAAMVEINWQNNASPTSDTATDMLQILVAVENENNTFFIENATERMNETYTLSLSNFQIGKTLHFWIAFRSQTEDQVSNSVYLGAIST